MRKLLMLIAGLAALIAFFLSLPTPPANGAATATSPESAIVIRNVRLFDGVAVHDAMTVVVEGGTIAAIGPAPSDGSGGATRERVVIPDGAEIIDGAGKTLMPGLIDAHTHTWGDALERALLFGVTTEIDMFTDQASAASMRSEQAEGSVHDRADLVSAGTLVTAAGGHGTEYGITIPTLDGPEQAQAFVDARLAEGSDFIKIVYDDAGGHWPTLDTATLRAAIEAAHARNVLAVVHVSTHEAARTAIEHGADGLVHVWSDELGADGLFAMAAEKGVFVIPTLSVTATMAGTPNVTHLDQDPAIAPYLTPAETGALSRVIEGLPVREDRLAIASKATHELATSGVVILAGTDAPNPGTVHGASMHGELSLLVEAGLSPIAALAAATAEPARAFGLDDRGLVAPGLRADLLLVDGDPTRDITRTRHIVGIWKAGRRVERSQGDTALEGRVKAPDTEAFAQFDQDILDAAFGFGWQPTTDERMGGTSTTSLTLVSPGSRDTAGALLVKGAIGPGFPFPWAGAMVFPGEQPMEMVDFSAKREVVFQARGDGGRYRLMLFAESIGQIPASTFFVASETWQEHRINLRELTQDLRGVWGLAFVAGPAQGDYAFEIDGVSIR